MKRSILIIIVILAIAGAGTSYFLQTPRDTVVFAVAYPTVSALPLIAVKKGFFAKEGLDLEVREYPTGKHALEAMLNGEAEIAGSASGPIIFNSFKQEPFRIIASTGETKNEYKIVTRKDANISELKDLKGKKIATQEKSDMHYFLSSVLMLNKMKDSDVAISFDPVEQLVSSLFTKKVDALAIREPFTSEARKLLGANNLVMLSEPRVAAHEFFILALDSTIKNKPNVPKKIIRALLRAEKFAKDNPDEAITIVADGLKIDHALMQTLWPDLDLRIVLKRSISTDLREQAVWAAEHNFMGAERIPDYQRLLYVDALREIKPDAIISIGQK